MKLLMVYPNKVMVVRAPLGLGVLPIFNKIRQQESKWDFNKKENWWTL